VDDDNRIAGWEGDTLVHVLNKSKANHPELQAIRASRPKARVVGDSLYDAAMAHGQQDVIRVRILDPRSDEKDNTQEQQRTFEKFDALISSGTLDPLSELVTAII
jgi:hypothetical protein